VNLPQLASDWNSVLNRCRSESYDIIQSTLALCRIFYYFVR